MTLQYPTDHWGIVVLDIAVGHRAVRRLAIEFFLPLLGVLEMEQLPVDVGGAASSAGRTLPYNLLSVPQIMEHLKFRTEARDSVDVENVASLGMHYDDKTGSILAIVPVKNHDGSVVMKELPLSNTAIRTGCKLMPGVTPEFFAGMDDPNSFPIAFGHYIDSVKRKKRGLVVRHDGLHVNALLPRDYLIHDAYHMLSDFIPTLEERVGKVIGVMGIEHNFGDEVSYRIVMGNNIMPSVVAGDGQYLMFNINMSESGLFDTKTSLGLYRTFCTNSAIRVQSLCKWNHLSDFGKFYDKAARTIRESGYLVSTYSRIFEEMLRKVLPFSVMELLEAIKRQKLIAPAHFDVAMIHAKTEDIETEYGLFNLLTRAAQDLPKIASRETAESNALKLFTEPGGMMEAIRRGESRSKKAHQGFSDIDEE